MQYISITCVMLIERSVRGRMCDSGSFLTILHLYIVLINNNRWRMYDDADGVKKFETLFKRNSICIIQIYQVICLVCLPISEKLNTLQFPRHVRVNIGRSCISTRAWYWYSGLLVIVNYGIFFFCRPVQHVLIKIPQGISVRFDTDCVWPAQKTWTGENRNSYISMADSKTQRHTNTYTHANIHT